MTPDEEMRRGEQARQLLEHPLLIESFAKIEQELMESWKDSPVRDVEGREKLHLTHLLLQKLKAEIQEIVVTGKIAEKQSLLEQAKTQAGRLFKFK